MKDVFISHIEEDGDVALGLALELERSGYSTWCYELDSVPGPTYFQQTRGAVVEAKVMVVIISPPSLGSQQIERELVRAFELRKAFIPILRDITHSEFQERQPEWADILGAAASVRVPPDGIRGVAPRVCEGLRRLGVPAGPPVPERVAELDSLLRSPDLGPAPPVKPTAVGRETAPPAPRRAWLTMSASLGGRRLRVVVTALALVVGLGAALSVQTFFRGPSTPRHADAPPAPPAETALVMGVMDIHARGEVPEWMRDFTRDGLNTVLSKAPTLKVFSKQKIDFVREKRGLTEIEAAEQLGIAKMISGTLTARDGHFVLEVQVVDIRTGLLEDSEQVEGRENELVDIQNRAAVKMVRAMKVSLNTDDLDRMFTRTNDSLDSYKLLSETLGGEPAKPDEEHPAPKRGAVFSWPATAWADEKSPDEAAVRGLLEKYRAALEAKDLDQLATTQEKMTEGQRDALARYFDNASGLKVQFTDLDILLEGDEALATFTRDDVFKDMRSGREMHLEMRMSSVLAKQAGEWKIRALKKPS